MTIPGWLRRALLRRLAAMASRREPDVIIGGKDDPYLLRWWVIPRNPVFNIYFHEFRRSDDDRALHDHPWWSISVILDETGYFEVMPAGHPSDTARTRAAWRSVGTVVFRRARAAHRLQLFAEADGMIPVRTLFITGPRLREWGFWCPQGWRHWREFTDSSGNRTGRGCQ